MIHQCRLFGYANENAEITNVGLENVDVKGGTGVGGLVGFNYGTVSESYVAGSVEGSIIESSAIYIGGLTGLNGGKVTNSHATGSVDGENDIGGLIGWNSGGTVSTSFATSSVDGSSDLGGLVGENDADVENSYWDTDRSGLSGDNDGIGDGDHDADQVEGLSTQEMQGSWAYDGADGNMSAFDFSGNWSTVAGDYPDLQDTPRKTSTPHRSAPGEAEQARILDDMETDGDFKLVTSDKALQAINRNDTTRGWDYRLVVDIDANGTHEWNGDSDPKGFDPIGEQYYPFTGTFDGKDHTISDLYINRDMNYVGLFGNGGPVENVGVEDVDITGNDYVGGLVGSSADAITDSYATGTVEGSGNGFDTNGDDVGGLIGVTTGAITDSYATVDVEGSGEDVGGLVGSSDDEVTGSYATGTVEGSGNVGGLVGNNNNGDVTESYATGEVVSDSDWVGGLVGQNSWSDVSDSYATGDVDGPGDVGGLVGDNYNGNVSESYATGDVDGDGDTDVGGLVGYNQGGDISDSYWDNGTTNQNDAIGTIDNDGSGTDLTGFGETSDTEPAAEMQNLNATVYMDGLDFYGTFMPRDGDYPELAWDSDYADGQEAYDGLVSGDGTDDDPYEVTDVYELQRANQDLDGHFELQNDIDAEDTDEWYNNSNPKGFAPIGDDNVGFTGTFNGSDNTVSNLSINRSSDDYVGLFGNVSGDGLIENVTLEAVDIHGISNVGGLVGYNDGDDNNQGTIRNSSATGSVTGESNAVGGLVGQNEGSGSRVEQSYATVAVNGSSQVGGLVGDNFGGTVSRSYATGAVDGATNNVGGLVGEITNGGTISESSATGAVYVGGGRVGGLVGSLGPVDTIENSSATGDVTGDEKVGGLVGQNGGTVTHAYAAGEVDGNKTVGGLIGDGKTVTESYWDTDTSGQEDSAGDATGLETVDMIGSDALDNMDGFDDSLWSTVTDDTAGADDDGYPILSVLDVEPQILTPDVSTDEDNDDDSNDDETTPSPGGTAGSSSSSSDSSSGETTISSNSDDESDDDSGGDNTDSDRPTPDTSISVTNPSPGQTIIIKDGVATLAGDDDENDDGEDASDDEDTDDGEDAGSDQDSSDDSSDQSETRSSNIRSDQLSIDINTDRDFTMDITNYESDLTPSSTLGDAQGAASMRPFASGGALLATSSNDEMTSNLAPDEVRAAADAFEGETGTVSVGYVDINHSLEPGEISGATFEFSVRQSYLDGLGADTEAVELNHERGDGWETRDTEYVGSDDTHAQYEAEMPEFSTFAIGTGAPVMRITDRTLETETITTGDAATVTVTVENRGRTAAEEEIELTADGETVATETVSVEPGETADLELSFTPEETGQYDLSVGGEEIQQLTVESDSSFPWLVLAIGIVGVLSVIVFWRRRENDENEATT